MPAQKWRSRSMPECIEFPYMHFSNDTNPIGSTVSHLLARSPAGITWPMLILILKSSNYQKLVVKFWNYFQKADFFSILAILPEWEAQAFAQS